MKESLLQQLEKNNEFTLEKRLLYANQLPPFLAAKQRCYMAARLLSERIMRYNIHEGLIDRPASRKGRYSKSTCAHILQVPTVKYLQSTYMPPKKLSAIARTLPHDDLKSLLLDRAALSLILPRVSLDIKPPVKKTMQGPDPGISAIYDNQAKSYDRIDTSWRRF